MPRECRFFFVISILQDNTPSFRTVFSINIQFFLSIFLLFSYFFLRFVHQAHRKVAPMPLLLVFTRSCQNGVRSVPLSKYLLCPQISGKVLGHSIDMNLMRVSGNQCFQVDFFFTYVYIFYFTLGTNINSVIFLFTTNFKQRKRAVRRQNYHHVLNTTACHSDRQRNTR